MTITRRRLSRGIKLTTDHVFDPIADASNALSGTISKAEMARPNGAFRVNVEWPYISGNDFLWHPFTGLAGPYEEAEIMLPFVLTPLQEYFSLSAGGSPDGATTVTTPIPILDELGISICQKDEPAAMRDPGFNPYLLDYYAPTVYELGVRLMKKKQLRIDSNAGRVFTQDVLSFQLDSNDAFMNSVYKLNPFTLTGINRAMDPYSTYLLLLRSPMSDAAIPAPLITLNYAFVSVCVTMKFLHPLVARDKHYGSAPYVVQNIPTKHDGVQNSASVPIVVPSPGTIIQADSDDGVQTNLDAIDVVFHNQLSGGYTVEGEIDPAEHVADDACYTIIALPFFNQGRIVTQATPDRLPYGAPPNYMTLTCDRRIVPITHPMTIHHVVAMANYVNAPGQLTNDIKPALASFVNQVGLAMGAGFRGDLHTYDQIAYLSFAGTDAARRTTVIDEIKHEAGGHMSDGDYDQILLHVPLVDAPAMGGVSYYDTGPPYYVGRATTSTQARENVGTVAGVAQAPNCNGQEQFLEARWSMQDADVGLVGHPATTVFVGVGGHWMFIIGKVHLTGDR